MSHSKIRDIVANAFLVLFTVVIVSLLCIRILSVPKVPRAYVSDGGVYDFGEIGEGETVRHVFSLANTGSETLKILDVVTGCGCASATADTREIEPGESAEIKFTYVGRRIRGRESVAAIVQTNDIRNPVLELILTGFVRLQVFWYPQSVSFFGEHGSVLEPKQVIFMAPRKPRDTFELEVVSVSNSIVSTELLDDERGIALRITISPDCPRGAHEEQIVIKHAQDESVKPIAIPVHVRIL